MTASYLIIARSARALVTSAKRAGYTVHCLDCFIDEDTKQQSDSVACLQYQDGFIATQVLGLAQARLARDPNIVIVTGTGFESELKLLDQLNQLAPVLSNNTNTIRALKNPYHFSQLLAKHAIKHPLPHASAPAIGTDYLVKKIAGTGGVHVQWLQQADRNKTDHYYQKFIGGVVLSALFLADGNKTQLLGLNQQLQTHQFQEMPFLYQGAIALNLMQSEPIVARCQDEITAIINIITSESGLRGLCGLDFILDNQGDIQVLEINPRPPATFELYEDEQSLFDAHIACFTEQGISVQTVANEIFNATAILYADQNLNQMKPCHWPAWVKDRPAVGFAIKKGAPICSVYASANSIKTTQKLLFERLAQIQSTIMTIQNAA